MSLPKSFLKNTFVNTTATIILSGLNFLLVPFMLHYLGTAHFGFLSFISVFSVGGYLGFLDFGLQAAMTKYVAEWHGAGEQNKLEKLICTSVVGLLFMGLVIAVAGVLLSGTIANLMNGISGDDVVLLRDCLAISFAGLLFQFPFLGLLGAIEGLQLFSASRTLQVSVTLASAIATVALLYTGHGVESVIVLNAISSVVQVLFSVVILRRALPTLQFRANNVSFGFLRSITHVSGLITLGRISSVLFEYSDRFLAGVFVGPQLVASVELIARFLKLIKVFTSFGNNVAVPLASQLKASGQQKDLIAFNRKGLRFNILICYPIILGAMIFIDRFIALWIGPGPENLSPWLQIIFLTNLLGIYSVFGGSVLLGGGEQLARFTRLSYYSLALKLVLSLLFLKTYELAAVSLGTLAARLLTFGPFLMILAQDFELSLSNFVREHLQLLIVLGPLVGLGFAIKTVLPATWLAIVGVSSIWILLAWSATYFFVLSEGERASVQGLFKRKAKLEPKLKA